MSIDISMQYDRLYRYCYYHTHNRILAQDIVQEAFTRYMERYGSLNEKNAVPYLYVIAKNLCRSAPIPIRQDKCWPGML